MLGCQECAGRGSVHVGMGRETVVGGLARSTYVQTHHSSRDCFQQRWQLNTRGQLSGQGGTVCVYSCQITGLRRARFPGGTAKRAWEEQSTPTGMLRVLVGGCIMSE